MRYLLAGQRNLLLRTENPEEEGIAISLLEHISPMEWESVILYGQYVIYPDRIRP